ncbi:MAG: hypothetical protein HY801_09845 [Candidatus Lindowbacteria bacterium]|nr:hypothetical protein [Candidatus Lindowbacteria bacterium]
MKKILQLILWYGLFIAALFLLPLLVVGKTAVLKSSERIKPYAVIFQTREKRTAARTNDEVIIFFGDSSVSGPPWAEKDKPRTPALLETELRESYPDLGRVSVLDWSFDGARLFHYYCLLFEAEKYSPALVIVPINWRGLGPTAAGWKELYDFPELSASVPLSERGFSPGKKFFAVEGISALKQINYLPMRPTLYITGLKMWARISLHMEPEEEPMSHLRGTLPDPAWLMTQLSDYYLFTQYPNDLSDRSVQLWSLRWLAETASRKNIRLLFYITPIHVEEIRNREVFDPVRFQQSLWKIAAFSNCGTSICVNLVDLLHEKDFIDCFEHYTHSGNTKVATALASSVNELMKSSARTNYSYSSTAKRDL